LSVGGGLTVGAGARDGRREGPGVVGVGHASTFHEHQAEVHGERQHAEQDDHGDCHDESGDPSFVVQKP